MPVDVLLVSLGSTHGWVTSDAAFAGALRRAGAVVAIERAARPREVRTLALTDLAWAVAARRAARRGIAAHAPRAIVYSTSTAALLWPRPGAIRFDALAAENRPGRHGLWQRRVEARRLAAAPLLLPMSTVAVGDAAKAVVIPPTVTPSGPPTPSGERDVAAVIYASDPVKKGLERVLDAWARARRGDEELVVFTEHAVPQAPGVRVEPVDRDAFRATLRRARTYVVAPRYEDFGIAQLEALADGCMLVTTDAPGPYEAREIARALDPRLVTDDLATALRTALDDPAPDYATRAAALVAPFSPEAVDARVASEVLPRLLDGVHPTT